MAAHLTDTIRIAVAQLDTRSSATSTATSQRRGAARAEAAADGADLLVLSELFIAGYPPEDLVLKPAFVDACRAAIEALAKDTADGGPGVVVGTPWPDGGKVYNAVALLDGGKVAGGSATRSSFPTTASSTSSASSRSGRFRVRSGFAASASACRSARTSGSSR